MKPSVAFALCLGLHAVACATPPPAADCEPDEEDCGAGDDGGGGGGKADGDGAVAPGSKAMMNDLTMVMPLARSQAELDAMLGATSAGAHGALLPKALFTGVFPDQGAGGVGSQVGMKYANLKVVAIRFDPCFAQIGPVTDDASCDNQIRLVFQDVTLTGGSASAIDGAVHAFYRVSRAELTAAIHDVIALRRAQGQTKTMGPLAPHPLLVKQGLDGAFGAGLVQIILAHAGADNLMRFTHLSSGNLSTVWSFAGYDVASGQTTAMVIPTLPAKATAGSVFAGFAATLDGGFTPETTSTDDVAIFVNTDKAKAAKATVTQDAYDASLRIENPGFHSPNTIDCASCHISQVARLTVGEDVLGLAASNDDDAFSADPKFVSKTNMRATTTPRKQATNVHMLSYRGDALMIGQRVINETANVVAYVNGTIHP